MLRYAVTRFVGLIATLLVTSFVIFGGLYLSPGGPLNSLLGGRSASPEQIAAVTKEYNLDQPFYERFTSFLGDIVQGDLGTSLIFRQPVTELIGPRIGVTVFLIVFALILVLLVGIGLGTLGGLRGGKLDTAVVIASSIGLATPAFVAAIILIALFAVQLEWFPVFGAGEGFLDRLWHMVLPAIALAASGQALVARVTRASVREEAAREHVATARSRGIPEREIVRRHVLRNALIPITTVGGITVAGLLAGGVVVENAFGLGGLGSLLVTSIQQKDYAVVQIIVLLFVATFVIVNTLVDLAYVAIDPRVRPWERA